jgi:exonuclease III
VGGREGGADVQTKKRTAPQRPEVADTNGRNTKRAHGSGALLKAQARNKRREAAKKQRLKDGQSRVPRIHAVTFNVNSCSSHAVTPEGKERRLRLVACLRNIMKNRNFGLLQETKYAELENADLEKEFPDFLFFRSNRRKGSAGVATMVRKSVQKKYEITILDSPEAAKGRVLALGFRSRDDKEDVVTGFNLVNVYLTSGQGDMTAKAAQIGSLKGLAGKYRNVIGGDFNFVECESDCTGSVENAELTGNAEKEWKEVCELLDLEEVRQDAHTRFARGKSPSSSRLDRFYVTSIPAEQTATVLQAYLLQSGGGEAGDKVGLAERVNQGKIFPLISRISDHLPLGLDMFAKAPRDRGEADIPAWAAKIEGFAVGVQKAFGEDRTNESAFAELDRWRKTVRRVYKQIVEGQTKLSEAYGGQARKLTKAITLYGLAMRTRPDVPNIEAMMKKFDFLKGLVRLDPKAEGNRYEAEPLQDFIHQLYGEGVREEATLCRKDLDNIQNPGVYLPGGTGGGDQLRELKTQLPGDRSRLSTLRPTVDKPATSEPAVLNKTIKRYYGGVWAESQEGATKTAINIYLQGYNKRVPAELRPVLPSCAEVMDQIH